MAKVTVETGTRIRLARIEAKMTQRQLAEKVGMSQGDISKIESGRQSPTGTTVDKIMKAIGGSVTLDALDGVLGIHGREQGKLRRIATLEEAPPIEWLIQGLVARGAVTMVAGAPGAGKSLLTQTLGVRMAELRAAASVHTHDEGCRDECPLDDLARAAGFDIKPGRVVVVDAENGEHIVQRRARGMGLTEAGSENYVVFEADGFDIEADSLTLDKLVADEHADFLILDSWMSLWGGSENSVDGVKRCLNGLRELAREHNIGILLIHHTTKDGGGYRGSGAIAGTIEAVFSFARAENGDNDDRMIFCEKMRLDAEPKTRRVKVTAHGVYDESDMI